MMDPLEYLFWAQREADRQAAEVRRRLIAQAQFSAAISEAAQLHAMLYGQAIVRWMFRP